MTWTLYSIGDSAYLEQILNAVAMIVGTGEFVVIAKIGFVLGILLVIFQAITTGGRGIDLGKILVAWIVFSMIYGASARVAIEDAYTGNVRVVDNVPIGVAAAGSIISRIGYRMTKIFETAFSTPAMTEYGFVGTLGKLKTVRDAARDLIGIGDANSPVAGSDFEQSWYNYAKECTLVGVRLGFLRSPDIMKSQDPVQALRFDSKVYHTEILVGGDHQVLNCSLAHDRLVDFSNTRFLPAFKKDLGALLRESTDAPGLSAAEVDAAIGTALNQLGQSASDASKYMMAATLLPIYQQAVIGMEVDSLQGEYAVMLSQAMLQRDTQWAAQESLFQQYVRPLMTFIEGFVFAVTPLMGFLVALGTFGIRLAGRYVLMLLWIQLWLPLLAVINLYILMSAGGDLDALQAMGTAVANSLAGSQRLYGVIQHYLATGGMLASSIPAIALMLVYGSAITATHLAGRLQAADNIDHKLPTPDVARQQPAFVNQSAYQQTPLGGTHMNGSDELMASVATDASLSQMVSSSGRKMRQASQSFQTQLGTRLSDSYKEGMSYDEMESLGRSLASGSTQTAVFVEQAAESFRQDYGISNGKEYAMASIVTGMASGSLRIDSGSIVNAFGKTVDRIEGIKDKIMHPFAGGDGRATADGSTEDQNGRKGEKGTGMGVGIEIKGGGRYTNTDKDASQTSKVFDILDKAGKDEGMRAELQQRMSRDLSDGHREGFEEALTQDNYEMLSNSASDVRSAAEEYAIADQAANRFQMGTSAGGTVATQRIAANDAAYTALDRAVRTNPDASSLKQDLLPQMKVLLPGNERGANVAANMLSLQRTGHQDAALSALGNAFGFTKGVEGINPFSNRHLENGAPVYGEAGNAPGMDSVGQGAHQAGRVEGDFGAARANFEQGSFRAPGNITGDHDSWRRDVNDAYGASVAEVRVGASGHYRDAIMRADSTPSAAAMGVGGVGGFLEQVTLQGRALAGDVEEVMRSGAVENFGFGADKGTLAANEEWIYTQSYGVAEGMGLTPIQSRVYARAVVESTSGRIVAGLGVESDTMLQLKEAMRGEYGGDDELSDKIFSMVANSALANPAWARSTLNSVRSYNETSGATK
ncbi:MAG: conjugal transfer protein TraG N-terminal domain-containing protein [Pseudomonadota bacterium]|nr:conjugal transfer protein TraG N-terminal domain-containing protein [Pseudomonadota bacterium]